MSTDPDPDRADRLTRRAEQFRAAGEIEIADGLDMLARIYAEPEMTEAETLLAHAARLRELGAGDAAELLEARAGDIEPKA